MGFYLRKSVSLGPIRLNFSKSGVGVSTGVKGALVAVVIVTQSKRPEQPQARPIQQRPTVAPLLSELPTQYVVKSGDTLTGIAERFYHSPAEWPRIFEANKSVVKDPNDLQVGMKLTIPE